MIETLLTILFIFLIFRLFSGWAIRYLLHRLAKRTRKEPFEQETTTASNRKKVFKKDDGEYVDYEEIKSHKPHD